MALNIKSPEVDRLAREVAVITGESLTQTVARALSERLERLRRPRVSARRAALRAIRERAARLPVLDSRSDDEILGYDENGTWNRW